MDSHYTKISYRYADAGNNKAHGFVYVKGEFSEEQLSIIARKLDEGEYFIPNPVGMLALQPTLVDFPSADDHVWHTLDMADFEVIDSLPESSQIMCTSRELTRKFEHVKWDIRAEHLRLGL